MSIGLEQAIAEYLSAPPAPLASFGGLYDDPDPANRVIFVQQEPRLAKASHSSNWFTPP